MRIQLSHLLALGQLAVSGVLARPEAATQAKRELVARSVDSFIAAERPYALSHILCSIGSTGCYAGGVASGLVIASPSKNDPPCELLCCHGNLETLTVNRLLHLDPRQRAHLQVPCRHVPARL